MYEEILTYVFPIMIAMILLSFGCAWVLTAVKSPESSGGKQHPAAESDWRFLDAGPEGVRKSVTQEIQTQTKMV
ncbi:MAG: hypothetical protein HY282_01270 [Nitrospirae bacterium]|nr:hypothetical protein [Candidatus Manganitrophaceae bacterium]